MPEGPEIKRAADNIAKVLEGQVAECVTFGLPRLMQYGSTLSGQKVLRIETRGKALLTHFDAGFSVYSHNQLYGKWMTVARDAYPQTNRQLRLAIHTSSHSALLYSASDIAVMPSAEVDQHPFLARIGPDILADSLTSAQIVERLLSKPFYRRSLAALYLDQRFIAGLGNYLRSEILFAAGVSPMSTPQTLSADALARLADVTLDIAWRSYLTRGYTVPQPMMDAAIEHNIPFEAGRFMVFDREDQPCRICEQRVRRITAQSRRLYFCSACQEVEG